MDWIIAKRRTALIMAAVSLALMLVSIMVRAFYTDGQFHPSLGWDIWVLAISTCCFGSFALWIFTQGFGPISRQRKTIMRWLARFYFCVSGAVALGTFVALIGTVIVGALGS
jgi:hypothetical protein